MRYRRRGYKTRNFSRGRRSYGRGRRSYSRGRRRVGRRIQIGYRF